MSGAPQTPSTGGAAPWTRAGVGLLVCVLLLGAGLWGVKRQLAQRPVNLREASASAADLLHKKLKQARIPDEAVQRAKPVLTRDKTAIWNAVTFEVAVPETIDLEGLAKFVTREMEKHDLRAVEEQAAVKPEPEEKAQGSEQTLRFAFQDHPFMTLVLREQAPKENFVAACTPIADATATFLASHGFAGDAVRRVASRPLSDSRAEWTLTCLAAPSAPPEQVEGLVGPLQQALASLEVEVAAKPGLNGSPKLTVSYRGAVCVEVTFGVAETPPSDAKQETPIAVHEPAPETGHSVHESPAGPLPASDAPVKAEAPEQPAPAVPVEGHAEPAPPTTPSEAPAAAPKHAESAPETKPVSADSGEAHAAAPDHGGEAQAEPGKPVSPAPDTAEQKTTPTSVEEKSALAETDPKLAALLAEIDKIPMDSAGLSKEELDTPAAAPPSGKPEPTTGKEPVKPEAKPAEPAGKSVPEKPRVAIVLDDGGYGGPITESVFTLDPGLTLAIMPRTPHSVDTARRAEEMKFGVMLHLPMEDSKSAGELTRTMKEQEMESLLTDALVQVPGAQGLNNHMGSAFTADTKAVDRFLEAFKNKAPGLFFLDSRTTGKSEAFAQAQALGIPAIARDVFLDHEETPAFIRKQFARMIEIAKARGHAVAICHFRPKTVQLLAELLPTLGKEGIELVHVSEMLR